METKISVITSTEHVIMHFIGSTVENFSISEGHEIASHFQYMENSYVIVITKSCLLKGENFSISMDFSTNISTLKEKQTFLVQQSQLPYPFNKYYSYYPERKMPKNSSSFQEWPFSLILTPSFNFLAARDFYPCFDQSEFLSDFHISFQHKPNHLVLSNLDPKEVIMSHELTGWLLRIEIFRSKASRESLK